MTNIEELKTKQAPLRRLNDDKMNLVAAAFARGATSGKMVAEATGLMQSTAANYLCWLRKAGGDAEAARKLMNDWSNRYQIARYQFDKNYREKAKAKRKLSRKIERRRDIEHSNNSSPREAA